MGAISATGAIAPIDQVGSKVLFSQYLFL